MNFDYIKGARTLLSESTDFQAWVGVVTAAAALPFILFHRQDVPTALKFAVLEPVSDSYERVGTGEGTGAFTNNFTCALTFVERFADEKDDWNITRTDSFFANVKLFIDYLMDNSQKTSPQPLIIIDTLNEETDGDFTMIYQSATDSGSVDKKGYFNKWIIGRNR